MHNYKWNQPIFILGNPRSGTSLLRLMLDTHSNISIPPESHFFLWLENKFGKWNPNLLESYIKELFDTTKFETWQLNKNELHSFLKKKNIKSYASLTSFVYYFYSHKQDNTSEFWGDKNSLWVEKLNKIDYYFPNAYYVYIIRDGRDIACSYRSLKKKNIQHKYAPKLDTNINVIAKQWSNNNRDIENYLSSISNKNKIQIYYEDLVINPKETLSKVLNILNLKVEDAQLNYFDRPKNNIEPEHFFSWKEKLLKPLDISNIGKYKKELSIKEIEQFNREAKEVLTQHNYL